MASVRISPIQMLGVPTTATGGVVVPVHERGPDADAERTAGASVVGETLTRRAIVASRQLANGKQKNAPK